jgi:tRNA threonylcarbamoyladenosine biosynthesis protein TsaB
MTDVNRAAMTSGQVFLCLDSSTPTARVAVLDGTGAVRFGCEATADRASGHLLPLVAEALAAVGVTPANLAGIACGGGPGSFTGLRVGLAAAKGLALPFGLPFYLVSSFEALALDLLIALGPEITAVPCLDAGKGEVYVGAYAADQASLVRELAPFCRLVPAALGDWMGGLPRPIVAGSGLARHPAAIDPARSSAVAGPTAISVGRLALERRGRGEVTDLEHAVPFYGRPPDITMKRNR